MVVGFIGMGNMGSAILKGIRANQSISSINVYDVAPATKDFCKTMGVNCCDSGQAVVSASDFIFLAVKPNIMADVISGILPSVTEEKVFISIAAGWSSRKLRDQFRSKCKTLRIMPNTPALVGEGFFAVSTDNALNDAELSAVIELLQPLGIIEVFDEKYFDAVTAVSGSGPAFCFLFLEAMADAAVKEGIPRKTAYKMAAQTLYGSAKMVLETGQHPAKLKDDVCSPGGTTIEGVASLEKDGFRSAVIKCIEAAAEKSKKLSN
ncbi:MAG: pyrroline-5-carboxylate reductase [Christensenellales bacterium]